PMLSKIALQIVRALLIAEILDQNRKHEVETDCSCRDEAEHGQAWVPENGESGLNLHQQGGPDDQRCDDQAGGDAICHFLESGQEQICVSGANLDFKLRVGDRIKNLVEALRQGRHEFFKFEQRTEHASGGGLLAHAAIEDL